MIVALTATALAALFLCMWFRSEIELAKYAQANRDLHNDLARERRRQFCAVLDKNDHRRSVT